MVSRAAVEFNRTSPPPRAPMREKAVYVLHGEKIPDPFDPLENMSSKRTRAWVNAQSARAKDFVHDAPGRAKTIATLKKLHGQFRETLPDKFGDRYFNKCQLDDLPHPVLLIRENFSKPPRILLSPGQMSPDGAFAVGETFPSPDGRFLAYLPAWQGMTSRLFVLDTETGENLPDAMPGNERSAVLWDRDAKSLYYSLEQSEESRCTIFHHVLGRPGPDRPILTLPEATQWVLRFTPTTHYDWMQVRDGTSMRNGLWQKPAGDDGADFTQIFPPLTALFDPIGEVKGRVFMRTDHDAPFGKLVSFDPDHPEPQNWRTVIAEQPGQVLAEAQMRRDKIAAIYLHNCAHEVRIFEQDGAFVRTLDLPAYSTMTLSHGAQEDPEIFIRATQFRHSAEIHKYNVGRDRLTIVQEPARNRKNLDRSIIETLHAISADGTSVPMTVVRNPATALDGTAATRLYAYGGFGIPETPYYDPGIVNWVANGGIYVMAHVRGGGEFGPAWHAAGALENKGNVIDDVVACADCLVGANYTKDGRIMLEGASHGGMLMLAVANKSPGRFGAISSDVPLTDLFSNVTWGTEFGDPEVKIFFDAIKGYAPLINIHKDKIYSPILIKAAENDHRALPFHAAKYAAALQTYAHPDSLCLFHLKKGEGHGGESSIQSHIEQEADVYAFYENVAGPVNQEKFKKWLAKEQKPEIALPSVG